MLHFAPFLSTPFELYALNPMLHFAPFLSKLQFFSCFEHFFDKVSESNPILHFAFFCPPLLSYTPELHVAFRAYGLGV